MEQFQKSELFLSFFFCLKPFLWLPISHIPFANILAIIGVWIKYFLMDRPSLSNSSYSSGFMTTAFGYVDD